MKKPPAQQQLPSFESRVDQPFSIAMHCRHPGCATVRNTVVLSRPFRCVFNGADCAVVFLDPFRPLTTRCCGTPPLATSHRGTAFRRLSPLLTVALLCWAGALRPLDDQRPDHRGTPARPPPAWHHRSRQPASANFLLVLLVLVLVLVVVVLVLLVLVLLVLPCSSSRSSRPSPSPSRSRSSSSSCSRNAAAASRSRSRRCPGWPTTTRPTSSTSGSTCPG